MSNLDKLIEKNLTKTKYSNKQNWHSKKHKNKFRELKKRAKQDYPYFAFKENKKIEKRFLKINNILDRKLTVNCYLEIPINDQYDSEFCDYKVFHYHFISESDRYIFGFSYKYELEIPPVTNLRELLNIFYYDNAFKEFILENILNYFSYQETVSTGYVRKEKDYEKLRQEILKEVHLYSGMRQTKKGRNVLKDDLKKVIKEYNEILKTDSDEVRDYYFNFKENDKETKLNTNFELIENNLNKDYREFEYIW